MSDLERLVHDLIARVDALERENRVLRRDLATVHAVIPPTPVAPVPASPASVDPLSRRRVLQRGLQAAAALGVAGVVTHHETREARADHSGNVVDVDMVRAHLVRVENGNGLSGVYGSAISAIEHSAGVAGDNYGTGPGVRGGSDSGTGVIGRGLIGVKGESSAAGYGANYGLHTNDGPGVVGDGHGPNWAGVLGRNPAAKGVEGIGLTGVLGTSPSSDGVRGEGVTGVRGKSSRGVGVVGEGGTGYGGVFRGARAQLRLTPTGRTGKPTAGSHQIGEVYLDKAGRLFICTVAGTPGTWRKVSTTTA